MESQVKLHSARNISGASQQNSYRNVLWKKTLHLHSGEESAVGYLQRKKPIALGLEQWNAQKDVRL